MTPKRTFGRSFQGLLAALFSPAPLLQGGVGKFPSEGYVRRRDFITALGAAATWPLAVRAQQSAKMKRIAFVNPAGNASRISATGPPQFRVFFEELNRLGYVEGGSLGVERYSGDGRPENYPELARDVVNTHPDLILAMGSHLALDFKKATTTITIVTIIIDPVVLGLVDSIARPGGNVTGVTVAGGLEIIGKRMGLQLEAMPKLSAVGYLASRPLWADAKGAAVREAAKRVSVSLLPAMLGAFDEAEYRRAFTSMERDRADALVLSDEPEHNLNRETIVELATRSRIPATYPLGEYVEAGGLMAYSIDLVDAFRRLAPYQEFLPLVAQTNSQCQRLLPQRSLAALHLLDNFCNRRSGTRMLL